MSNVIQFPVAVSTGLTPGELFNCCPGLAAPDWALFDALEVGGCCDVAEEGADETCIEGGKTRDEAEFFTVYGRLKEGGCEAITDLDTYEHAKFAAHALGDLSGLPVHICC